MRFIHIADVHACKERIGQTETIFNKLIETCKTQKIDYVLFCGDFWDKVVTNSSASGLPNMNLLMRKLSEISPVIMIYGTASHEADGSLEIFKSDRCEVYDKISLIKKDDCDIIAIPEPRRQQFLSNTEVETTKKIMKYLSVLGSGEYVKKDKPCIVMYHGEIVGAKYQNGIKATSPIALPKEKLQSIGADYYACGHIHEPQKMFPNCFYVGSSCPVNMGETHDGHFSIVEITNKVSVENVSFGFPQNITLNVKEDDIQELMEKDFTGKNIKLCFTTKTPNRYLPLKKLFLENTHANSLLLNIDTAKTTNVRSKQIIEQKSIVDKFETYARLNHVQYADSILKKIKDLEDEVLIKYSFPKHSFELLWVSIRGAIGITQKEEFTINFEDYKDGVIVFTGANGMGKSTVIENCHPYPQMLTRTGKLRDHFYLKDSYRKLIYRDETGLYYRITISIVANIATGITKYYVETSKDRENWSAVTEVDGNLDSYNKYINETFGSIELFLKTSFFAKEQTKGYPDIAFATKGERSALFAELAGQNYIATLLSSVKEKSKELEYDLKASQNLIADKDLYEKKKVEYLGLQQEHEKEVAKFSEILDAKKVVLKELHEKDKEYQRYVEHKRWYVNMCDEHRKTIRNNEVTIASLKAEADKIAFVKAHKTEIKLYADLVKNKDDITKAIQDIESQIATLSNSLVEKNSVVSSVKDKMNDVQKKIDKKNYEVKVLENKITDTDLDYCSVCGAKLSSEKKKEIKATVDALNFQIADINNQTEKIIATEMSPLENELKVAENELNDIQASVDVITQDKDSKKATLANCEKDINTYSAFADYVSFIGASFNDNVIQNADVAIQKLVKENERLQGIIDGCSDIVPKEDVSLQIEKCNNEIDEVTGELNNATSFLVGAKTNYENAVTELKKIAQAEKELQGKQNDFNEYAILQKAFSSSGIQALELEAIVPTVADITNRILHSSYGDKFNIYFETLRQGAKNMVEDFNIMATNTQTGRSCPIAMLSSGELIWVKQALFFAFSIIRERNSGFAFKTRFMDESDGSLDSNMRVSYLKMINSTLLEGNATKTILISHSQEIKEIAEQFITL